jgi:putative membrane-bound dehydrogenase-like protein
MKRLASACLVFLLLVSSARAMDDPRPATVQVRLNGHTFTLPAGFEIELVAGPPLVDRPIVADFDEQGRLYVADSSGSNENVSEQLKKKPHRIVRLEDTKGDGHFDKRTIFADKMMFPEGVMCYEGSVYVGAPPTIWKLTDTKGDGLADQRVEWLHQTLTGCANDLHGPYLGPDGWIYWCKGAFAKQSYERPGRPPFMTRAAHIFRSRPDGSGIEPVMTGGMDNPVTVVFTPGGERIFTTTFLQSPGGGKRDGLIHAIYGGIYGKENDVNNDHPWTGPSLMPVLVHMGPAAPAGLVRYESSIFGLEYQDNLFACLFNMHKVTRHILEPVGSTFKTRDEDFLVSDNFDFHPTCVLEDADGSLLVIDTGGWYKLCCPTSQLHKPDILGAIYRIRRKGMPQLDDPRGLKVNWDRLSVDELVALLGHRSRAIANRAIKTLAAKGVEALPALERIGGPAQGTKHHLKAIWAATRIDDAQARRFIRTKVIDPDEAVAQAAIHSVSLWRDREALPDMILLLKSPSLHHRRAAAEAIGRIGDRSAVPALLLAAGEPNDRMLEHSLTYALIEIAGHDETRAGLTSPNPRTQRTALIALDQMVGGDLKAADVTPALTSDDPSIREAAFWIVGRHPQWGDALAGYLTARLAKEGLSVAERQELAGQFARFAKAPAIQAFLAERVADNKSQKTGRLIALAAMGQSSLRQAPTSWIIALTKVVTSDDGDLVREAVTTLRALAMPKSSLVELKKALLDLAHNDSAAAQVRLAALAAIPGGPSNLDPPVLALVLANIDQEKPVVIRSLAAEVLSRAHLDRAQLLELVQAMGTVGPMELERILPAFAGCNDDEIGKKLVGALQASPARSSLRLDGIKPNIAKFGSSVQAQAEGLYAILDADSVKQREKLEKMLGSLHGGDVRRGQVVFNGPKAACASCHAVGYMGGNIGPDLTRIGSVRAERDLLESIVFPSASFVRSYEPVVVVTKQGKLHNGLVKKDTPEEILLTVSATEEVHIPREAVDEIRPSKVSVMPAGLDQQLSERDIADLVAFLKACK